jgi:hypothetical protein
MSKLNFSMFPVNEIKHPETSLLITKCAETSPNLHDLDESEFGKALTNYLPCKTIAAIQYRHKPNTLFKSAERDAGIHL